MKFSPLALVLFASTTLVSVTSAADTGGVRGSIDQTQSRRSLGVYMGFTDFAENANSPASLQAQKDWFRHQYIEEDWEDLPLKVQNAAKLLGFTERSWNAEDDSEKLNTHIYDSDESNGDFHGDKPSDDSEKLNTHIYDSDESDGNSKPATKYCRYWFFCRAAFVQPTQPQQLPPTRIPVPAKPVN